MPGIIKYDKHKHRSAPAQSLVEVALLLPILLLLVLGAIDFGRLFMTKFILTNSAKEGATYISYYANKVTDPWTALYTVVKEEALSSGVSVSDEEITFTGCCAQDVPVTVTVTKEVDLIFDGFLQAVGIINGPMTVSGSVQMMVLVRP
jgi:Flp pilus assembly protein TadG